MPFGAAGLAEAEFTDADLEAFATGVVILTGVLILLGLAILVWTSRNRAKVCGYIAAVIVGLALIESLITWLWNHS